MASSFNYSIADDTLNGVLNGSSLEVEISASSITIAVDNVSSSGDTATVTFKTDISAGEETTLNGIVAAHTGEAIAEPEAAKDSENALITRPKAAPAGWHFEPQCINFTTASNQDFYNKDKDGDDLGHVTFVMKDTNGDTTTTDANAVTTEISWTPEWDYEIIGGKLMQAAPPTNAMYMYVEGPFGSRFSSGGINLKLAGTGNEIDLDGRVSKRLNYNNPIAGTNTLKVIVKHNAGDQHEMQLVLQLFKA